MVSESDRLARAFLGPIRKTGLIADAPTGYRKLPMCVLVSVEMTQPPDNGLPSERTMPKFSGR